MYDWKNYKAPEKSTFFRDAFLTVAIIATVLLLSHLDNEEHEARLEQIKQARMK